MQDKTTNKIIGWCNIEEERVLCNLCFKNAYKDKDIKWSPIRAEEGEDNMETCDTCQKRLAS